MDIIDENKLTALYGHKDTAIDIIHMFVDQAPQLLEDIETAMKDNDDSALSKICHKGVGQARYIASPLIEETIIDLQKAAPNEKPVHFSSLSNYIQKLSDEYA